MFIRNDLKGQDQEIFSSVFLHESVSPKPLTNPLGPLRIFLIICGDTVFTAQGLVDTGVANGKNLQSEISLFIHLWVVELTYG